MKEGMRHSQVTSWNYFLNQMKLLEWTTVFLKEFDDRDSGFGGLYLSIKLYIREKIFSENKKFKIIFFTLIVNVMIFSGLE